MATKKDNPIAEPESGEWLLVELPETDYTRARDLQASLVESRKKRLFDKDIVLMLEHPPVFTLGRRGGLENLTVSGEFLEKSGIEVIHAERGGDITFHGPGQIVMYPIVDLRAARLGVLDFVERLEEVMIRAASDAGIAAGRDPRNRGVWVGDRKLGSIGIAIRRGISFHGLAFNVNLSLKPFDWIYPCGLKDIGVTSLKRELSREVSMDEVREAVKRHFEAVFNIRLLATTLSSLPC